MVNTKYISSSAVKKISIFHECIAQVKMLIFSPHEMKYIWYLPKKGKFYFYFILNRTDAQPNLFPGRFSLDLTFSVCLLGTTLGVNTKFAPRKSLESHFNERNARNQHLQNVY